MGGSAVNILALDPSTHCGFAHSCGISGTWDLSVRRDESAGMRLIRFRSKLAEMARSTPIELVVYEAARHSAPKMQGALVVQAMIQGVLLTWCEERGYPYRGYSPSEIKKRATSKGNSSKDLVLAAAQAKWPNVKDDNEADALWLLDLAMSEYAEAALKAEVPYEAVIENLQAEIAEMRNIEADQRRYGRRHGSHPHDCEGLDDD